jgi:hypothetical protein
MVVVATVASTFRTNGPGTTVAALVLAPVAVLATAAVARRIAGELFAVVAAATYVLLPLLANRFMLESYRMTFDREALPDLVGLRATPWFGLGVLATAVLVAAPRRAAGIAGIAAATAALISWGTGALAAVHSGLHETAWSITLLEWFLVAGVVGAARRDRWLALALGGWLIALIAHAAYVGYDKAAFWQSLSAGAPAASLLLSSLVLLVPPLRRPRAVQQSEHAG